MANSYPGIGGALRSLPFDAATDPRKGFYVADDFIGAITGGMGWTLTGTGGTATFPAAEADAPGIVRLTGATTGFAAGLSLANFPFKASAVGQLYMACRFRIPTALTNREVRVGFASVAPTTAQPDFGVWLEYDAAVDADDWQVGSDDGTTDVQLVAGANVPTPVFGQWYTAEVLLTTTDAKVYLDGLLVHQTPITAVTTAALSPFVYTGDGTNASTLDVDYITVKGIHARAGFVAV